MTNRPPQSTRPPDAIELDGRAIDLASLADEICSVYFEEHPNDPSTDDGLAAQWCRHDNQWIIYWAVADLLGATSLNEQVQWLAGVLRARNFPLERLAQNLEIAARVVAESDLGDRAAAVSSRLADAGSVVREIP